MPKPMPPNKIPIMAAAVGFRLTLFNFKRWHLLTYYFCEKRDYFYVNFSF